MYGHGHINLWRDAQGISSAECMGIEYAHYTLNFMTKRMKQAPLHLCVIAYDSGCQLQNVVIKIQSSKYDFTL